MHPEDPQPTTLNLQPSELNITIHSPLYQTVVLDLYLYSIHKVGTLIPRLYGLRSELRLVGNPRYNAIIRLTAFLALVSEHLYLLSYFQCSKLVSGNICTQFHTRYVRDFEQGTPQYGIFTRLSILRQDNTLYRTGNDSISYLVLYLRHLCADARTLLSKTAVIAAYLFLCCSKLLLQHFYLIVYIVHLFCRCRMRCQQFHETFLFPLHVGYLLTY